MDRSRWRSRGERCSRALSRVLMLLLRSCSSVRFVRSPKMEPGSWSRKLLDRSNRCRLDRLAKAQLGRALSLLFKSKRVRVAAGRSGGTVVRPRPLQSTSRLWVSHLQEKGQAGRASTAYRVIQQVIPGGVGVGGGQTGGKKVTGRVTASCSIPSLLVHIIKVFWLDLLWCKPQSMHKHLLHP